MSCIAYPFTPKEGYPTQDEPDTEKWSRRKKTRFQGSEELATIIYTSGTLNAQRGDAQIFHFGFATVNAVSQIVLKNTERFFLPAFVPHCRAFTGRNG